MAAQHNKKPWILGLFVLLAAIGLVLAFWKLLRIPVVFGVPMLPPSPGNILGTNGSGQDVLLELAHGAHTTLVTALAAAALATGVGSITGGVAGYLRGRTDLFLMRITDIFLVLPGLPFMILLASLLPLGTASIILAVAVTSWPPTARVVRSHVLQLREQGFVLAARGLGAGHLSIIFGHILPNSGQIILAKASLAVASAMLAEAGLSFLGLGDPVRKSWGAMLHDAFAGGALTNGAWWWYGPPMICLSLFVLLFMSLAHSWIHPVPARFSTSAAKKSCVRLSLNEAMISAQKLCVSFPNPTFFSQAALKDVSFDVGPGEKVAICGHTASGKSLLLLSMLGLLPPASNTKGKMFVAGIETGSATHEQLRLLRRKTLAYVPQATSLALNPVLRLGSQILEKAELFGNRPRLQLYDDALKLLESMGFDRPKDLMDKYPHHLSGGMRQRAAFAMALLGDFKILLADEPTKNLDAQSRMACLNILAAIEEKTVITVTHDLDLARRTSTRILHMGAGLLLEDATVEDFFARPLHPFSRAMIDSMPQNGFGSSASLCIPQTISEKLNGCPFIGDCPHALALCSKIPPVFNSGQTRVRCWLYAS